ncbi:hypothetical protein [Microlunatus sp. GCM10028923]|uniref:hypothetical protein n=1 Tax=Microlunatus sp. GCM10028923 TaxID=3273400 RepID=UPI00361F4408
MSTDERPPDGYTDEELARRQARDAEVLRLQAAGRCYHRHDQQVGGELLGRETVIAVRLSSSAAVDPRYLGSLIGSARFEARRPQRSLSLSKGKARSGLALRQAQGANIQRPLRDAAVLTGAVRERLGEAWQA